MKQLQPVLWTRGVLLAPQHLQMQDRFLEDAMQFRLSALSSCRWGFQRLEIDEEALALPATASTGQPAAIAPLPTFYRTLAPKAQIQLAAITSLLRL